VLLTDAQQWEVGLEVSVQVVAGLLRCCSAGVLADVVATRARHRGVSRSVWPWRLCSGSSAQKEAGSLAADTHLFRNMAADQNLAVLCECFQRYRSMEEAALEGRGCRKAVIAGLAHARTVVECKQR